MHAFAAGCKTGFGKFREIPSANLRNETNCVCKSDFRGMILARCMFPLAIVASLVAALPSFAKRAAPVPVAPLVVGETTFRVQHSPLGLVEAVDTKSGNPLWTKQIYVTRYDPALEHF